MNNSNFETELRQKGKIIYTNVGDSMMPLIKEGRDVLIIVAPKEWSEPNIRKLKKGDVALYKRKSGQYVLHRVIKVREKDYVFCGDNRFREEEGIDDSNVIGKLTGIITDGKERSLDTPSYQAYVKRILFIHPIRVLVHKIKKKMKNG